jgi:hypothetical protein
MGKDTGGGLLLKPCIWSQVSPVVMPTTSRRDLPRHLRAPERSAQSNGSCEWVVR